MWYLLLIEYLQMSLSVRLSEDVASRWRWQAESQPTRLSIIANEPQELCLCWGIRTFGSPVRRSPDDRNLCWSKSATKSGQKWNLILLWRICRLGAIFHTSSFRLIVHIKRTKLVNLNSVNRNPFSNIFGVRLRKVELSKGGCTSSLTLLV